MPDSEAPPRVTWRDWLPVAAIILTVAGAILVFGGYVNELKEHERRIAVLESRAQQQDATLSQIQITTTRTDATLQALRDKRGDLQP